MTRSRKPISIPIEEPGSTLKAPKKKKTAPSGKQQSAPAKQEQKRTPRAIKSSAALKKIDATLEAEQPIESFDLDERPVDRGSSPPATKRSRVGGWIASILGLLVLLAAGLWLDELIRSLFERHEWLGWLSVALTALLVVLLLVGLIRELISLVRLNRAEGLRELASAAEAENNTQKAQRFTKKVVDHLANQPLTARGRAQISDLEGDVLDAHSLIELTERELMTPLDDQAKVLVMESAKRVSLVTAVSPRAILDVAFVVYENLRMIRRIAEVYAMRPSYFGTWRLVRRILVHVAVSGSVALADGLLQQVLGQSVVSKLSRRFGEGVINGLLTARIGILAQEVCRPMAFSVKRTPKLADYLAVLTRSGNAKDIGKK